MSLSLPKQRAFELSFIFHDMHLKSSVGMCKKLFHTEQPEFDLIKEKLIIESDRHECFSRDNNKKL